MRISFPASRCCSPYLLSAEFGKKSHRTVFADANQNEGYIEHRKSGQRTRMFSKDGVYFVKIKLQPERSPKGQVHPEPFCQADDSNCTIVCPAIVSPNPSESVVDGVEDVAEVVGN